MSKRRSLAGITADNPESNNKQQNMTLPITAMATGEQVHESPKGEPKRAYEYEVDPELCIPWKFHNRDDAWMNSDRCKDLISSIRKNGQKFPVLARPLEDNKDGYQWEIVAGRRRWFACKHLKIKLRLKGIKPSESSDRDCAILMNLENKDRDDVTEFEDAISYRQQLDGGLFDSQDDMAAALDLNKSKLSKMLAASKITKHTDVMKLFDDITTLKINPVYKLVVELEKSKANRDVIIQKAKNLYKSSLESNLKLSTVVIINKLLSSLENSSKVDTFYNKSYKLDGKVVLTVKEQKDGKVLFEIDTKKVKDIKNLEKVTLKAFDDLLENSPVS